MKKLLACLLACFMTLSTSCFATEIDLSSLSDAELTALLQDVNAEYEKRNMTEKLGTQIPSGDYEVGVDIKEGRYIFIGRGPIYVPYIELEDETIKLHFLEQHVVTLTEGQKLFVSNNVGIAELSEEKDFWQP